MRHASLIWRTTLAWLVWLRQCEEHLEDGHPQLSVELGATTMPSGRECGKKSHADSTSTWTFHSTKTRLTHAQTSSEGNLHAGSNASMLQIDKAPPTDSAVSPMRGCRALSQQHVPSLSRKRSYVHGMPLIRRGNRKTLQHLSGDASVKPPHHLQNRKIQSQPINHSRSVLAYAVLVSTPNSTSPPSHRIQPPNVLLMNQHFYHRFCVR